MISAICSWRVSLQNITGNKRNQAEHCLRGGSVLNKKRNSEIHSGYGSSQSFCFAANDTGSISLIKEFFRYKAVLVYKEWLFYLS